jgi:enamine deaminase RidA (YjgF/YER057c/UK114 family)
MESLGETLEFLGLSWKEAVQLKAFVQPITDASKVLSEMRKFAVDGQPLPIVLVEWQGGGVPIEIELIAAAPSGTMAGALDFPTPPSLKPSPVFSRVARFGAGPRIYFSGLHPASSSDPAAQVRDVFMQMKRGLGAAHSDLQHLVKATYYVASDASSKALNEVRPEYYDPARPPAASKAMVKSVAAGEAAFTIDMIAVPNR